MNVFIFLLPVALESIIHRQKDSRFLIGETGILLFLGMLWLNRQDPSYTGDPGEELRDQNRYGENDQDPDQVKTKVLKVPSRIDPQYPQKTQDHMDAVDVHGAHGQEGDEPASARPSDLLGEDVQTEGESQSSQPGIACGPQFPLLRQSASQQFLFQTQQGKGRGHEEKCDGDMALFPRLIEPVMHQRTQHEVEQIAAGIADGKQGLPQSGQTVGRHTL